MHPGLARIISIALTGVAIAFASALAHASSVLPLDLDGLVAGAQSIVQVRCTGNLVQPDPTVGAVTVTTFVVLDRAKGPASVTFTLRQAGGELDGRVIDFHTPKFHVGDEYVLFVPPASRLGLASPVGLTQGVFAVAPTAAGKEVGNGRDFAALLAGADVSRLPPGIATRMQRAEPERARVALGDFMTLLRTKAGTP
ncbi:MAG: hypothetical protein ABI831_08920 [Betaproteobacteria bacterium]